MMTTSGAAPDLNVQTARGIERGRHHAAAASSAGTSIASRSDGFNNQYAHCSFHVLVAPKKGASGEAAKSRRLPEHPALRFGTQLGYSRGVPALRWLIIRCYVVLGLL